MEDRNQELFLNAWRSSDFYLWVMKILDEEIESNYVKELVMTSLLNDAPMSSEEIGDATKIEIQTSLRLKSIKERLE